MIPPLRRLPYRDFTIVWTFGAVRSDVLGRVPDALRTVLRDPAAVGLRALLGDRAAASLDSAVILHTDEALSTAAAIDRLRGAVTPADPLRILISERRITFAVSHAVADGRGVAELIGAVMAKAAGCRPRLDGRPRVRFPLLVGLRAVGTAGVRSYLDRRRSAVIIGPEVVSRTPGPALAVELPLSAEMMKRIEHLPSNGRSTVGARVASVAIAALRQVQRRDVDVPVAVPISLLRHVGNRHVLGNFVGIEPIGTLRGTDWTPGAISAALTDAAKSGRAMAGLGYAILRAIRYGFLPRRPAIAHARVAISMQMISLPKLLPDVAWASDEHLSCAATIGPWPSSVALAPYRLGDRWGISVWDESGEFDLDSYRDALDDVLRQRESARSKSHP